MANKGGTAGDSNNLGFYATESALTTAYPTGSDGQFAIVGATDTVWAWDSDTSAWVDTGSSSAVDSVNGATGVVVLTAADVPVPASGKTLYVEANASTYTADGTREKPYKTFSAALTAATAGDVVACLDSSTYAESVTCVDGVDIYAPNATLDLGSTGDQLDLANCSVEFGYITRTTGGASAILSSAGGGEARLRVREITDAGAGITIRNTVSTVLEIDVASIFVNGGGIGIADFSSGVPQLR